MSNHLKNLKPYEVFHRIQGKCPNSKDGEMLGLHDTATIGFIQEYSEEIGRQTVKKVIYCRTCDRVFEEVYNYDHTIKTKEKDR